MAVDSLHAPSGDTEFTERQAAVLEIALNLLVQGGDKALTTAGLAKAANCSKESLYKWFGDRDGILAAIVTFQASKVRGADDRALPSTKDAFDAALLAFAEDLLEVLLSETSLALNRLSIGQVPGEHVRGESAGLGALLVDRGKRRIEARATQLLTHGKRQRFIAFDTAQEAYTLLYGLIVGDLHIRALLGDDPELNEGDRRARAAKAIDTFLSLYATALS
ncbi:MAG: TetR/AcrR family transcriptional regulator [Pseudomonadota bacterium]